jgi:hypothetical protein
MLQHVVRAPALQVVGHDEHFPFFAHSLQRTAAANATRLGPSNDGSAAGEATAPLVSVKPGMPRARRGAFVLQSPGQQETRLARPIGMEPTLPMDESLTMGQPG